MKRSNVFNSLAVFFVFSLFIWGFVPSEIEGAVPQLINFQGVLRDGSGNPVPDNSYSVTFTIYDAATGGNNLWAETQSVSTTGGLFAVLLGSVNPVPDTTFKGTNRWLGIAVSPDGEMPTRQQLVSVGYAYRVNSIDGATGGTIFGNTSIQSNLAVNGTIDATGMSSKIRFHYDDVSLFPSASTYHGMFAHAHNQGAAYYAHAAQWVRLADSAHPHSSLAASDLSPNPALSVDTAGKVGIGTTTPSAKLEVLNSVSSADAQQGVVGVVSNLSTGSAFGGIFTAISAGTGIKSGVRGNASSPSGNPAYGVYGEADNSSTGNAYAGFFNVPFSGGTGASYGVYSSVADVNGWGFYTANNAYLGGNVGIGTTSPQQKLEVRNGGIGIDNLSAIVFRQAGNANYRHGIRATANDALAFETGNFVERMRISDAGNVGIGTTSPTEKLHVAGNICATGTIGACSDARFKRDIRPVDGSLDKIEKLQGVTYRWNRDEYPQFAEGNQIGFVAQEVKEVLPEVVSEGSDGTLSVDYGRFSVVLLEAIKEQQREIKELKAAIEKLQVERR